MTISGRPGLTVIWKANALPFLSSSITFPYFQETTTTVTTTTTTTTTIVYGQLGKSRTFLELFNSLYRVSFRIRPFPNYAPSQLHIFLIIECVIFSVSLRLGLLFRWYVLLLHQYEPANNGCSRGCLPVVGSRRSFDFYRKSSRKWFYL